MQLTAIITKDELVGLLGELTPLRVGLGLRRSVSFGPPHQSELVSGAGLRIRGSARLVWDIAGLSLPIALRGFQILLVPSVVLREGAHVLALDPVLERLDFKRIRGFFDDRIIDAINEGLASQRRKLVWNVSRALSIHKPLPARFEPRTMFDLAPTRARVSVTDSDLRIDLAFEAHVTPLPEDTGKSLGVRPGAARPS